MAFTYEHLLAYRLPEVRQTYSRRDSAFYALSIGLGHDPTDENQLAFADFDKVAMAFPTMAVVLGYPGPWMRDPATGITYSQVLHGEQEIILHRPLPAAAGIVAHNRVLDVIDKGPGRGALLLVERTIFDEATQEALATVIQTNFLRGDGGFGGPPRQARATHPIPDGSPLVSVDYATRPEQALYFRFQGDDNPLHADPETAKRAGFNRPILHGLCTMGVAVHAVVAHLLGYRADRVQSVSLRFASPVLPGDTLRVEVWDNGAFRATVPERGVVAITNGLLRWT